MPDRLQSWLSLSELFTTPHGLVTLAILLVIVLMAIIGGRSVIACPRCGSPNGCDCADRSADGDD